MVFQVGNVAGPITPIKREPHAVFDCQLASASPFIRAFVKVLPPNLLAVESVCVWIGRDLGLPLPIPYFARIRQGICERYRCPWPYLEETAITFGSQAIENSIQIARVNRSVITGIIDKWSLLELAAAYDHLIANDDRSEGNILLDGRQNLWLIDHTRTLGGGVRLFSSEYFPSFTNFWLSRIAQMPVSERIRRKDHICRASDAVCARVNRIPYDALGIADELAQQIQIFLNRRSERLLPMLLSEIGMPALPSG
jgi:hypothetical protein